MSTLEDLRTEVKAHGFAPNSFPNSRLNQFLNDGLFELCRRVSYYQDEASYDFTTVSGTATYALPTGFAKIRELRNTQLPQILQAVLLRDIDQSVTSSGPPAYYALDGLSARVYPTPDGPYSMEMRYWAVPAKLVQDTDVPSLPEDYHNLLWMYAVGECYAAEDDSQTAQFWMQRFEKQLGFFSIEQKFPNDDSPTQVRGMWDRDASLGMPGWGGW